MVNALKSYQVFFFSQFMHASCALSLSNLDFSFSVQKAWLPGSCSLNVKHVYIIPMYKSISSVWFTNICNSHIIKLLDEARL